VAQPRKRRKRKHRGTPAGTIERAARDTERRRRPETKGDRRGDARHRRLERLDRPPSWSSAIQRAAIAAALFAVVVVLAFDEPLQNAVTLAAFMLLIYIPFGYFFDTLVYRRRQKSKQRRAARDGM
jgi:Flp pilus assembly protein TadB